MSKRSNNKRRERRPPAPYFNEFPPFEIPPFDIPQCDIPQFDGTEIQVIGNPAETTGPPVIREATLDDCDDDCPICVMLRQQILAGKPPQVMVFE
jgi:hypothetical protein